VVVAWLGIGTGNSKLAMKFIQTVTEKETGFQNPLGRGTSGNNSVEGETKFWGFVDQASKVFMEVKNLLPEKGSGIMNTFHDRSSEDCGDSAKKEKSPSGKQSEPGEEDHGNMQFILGDPETSSNKTTRYFKIEDGETRKALVDFFSLDYWGRLWISQEISVASEVLVYCGADSTSLRNIEIVLARTKVGEDF
jgi:hypothetical protein